jgi:hypothetical protein
VLRYNLSLGTKRTGIKPTGSLISLINRYFDTQRAF